MRRSVWERIREILKKHVIHGKWVRAVISLACVVIFITTYVLIMPAVTLSRAADCGQEEHTHTEDCYETESELTCGQEEHTHSGDCYDEEGNLICGMEEHVHDDGCYTSREVLVCGQEEHVHTEDCYAETETIQEDTPEEEYEEEQEEPAAADEEEQPQVGETVTEQVVTAAPEQLSQIRFKDHLTDWTTLYYAPEDGDSWQPLAEDKWHSLYGDNWGIRRNGTEDRSLDPEEYVLLHIGYRIPAGRINATNPEAEFILPLSINMTEEEVRENNKYYDTLFSGTDREADELFADGEYEIKEEWNSDGEVTQRKLVITFNEDACLRCGGEKLTDGTETLAAEELEGFFELRVKAEDLLTLEKKSESAYVLEWNDEENLDTTVRFDPEKLAAYYDTENTDDAEAETEGPVSGELRAEGKDYTITVSYTEEASLPADVSLKVKEITRKKEYESYKAQMEEELIDLESTQVTGARFFDITLEDNEGNELHPESGVRVLIETKDTLQENEKVQICHFDEEKDKPVEVESREVTGGTYEEENLGVEFEAESFSVYGVVYTVDFEYSVNGKMYQFSLPGGGFVSFTDLIEVLGIIGDMYSEENGDENESTIVENAEENSINVGAEENSINSDTNTALTLGDVEVSEATKKFVTNVASIEFSSPELVDVSKVEADITVGQIKENRGLECEYSAELTEEQIAEINAQTVEAGDWALISVQPFTSEEEITVTLKDGEVFSIRVTDAQIKKTVIDAKGDTWEITVTYGEDAQIPDGAELKVREMLPEDRKYEEYYQQSLKKTREGIDTEVSSDDFGYAHIFDIEILDQGQKIEPEANVSVTIKLLDTPQEIATLRVVHFSTEGPEIIDIEENKEKGGETELGFVTDEFSVYAVIEDVDHGEPDLANRTVKISVGGYYLTNQNNYNENPWRIRKTNNFNQAAEYQFEATGTPGVYKVYTMVNGQKNYMHINHHSGNPHSDDENSACVNLTGQEYTMDLHVVQNTDGTYGIFQNNGGANYYLNQYGGAGGTGFAAYADADGGGNSKLTFTSVPADPNALKAGTHIMLAKIDEYYYIVNNDGTLTSVEYIEATNQVKVDNPMMWTFTGTNLYHNSDAVDFDGSMVASDFYYKYIDPSTGTGISEDNDDNTTTEIAGYKEVDGVWVPYYRIVSGTRQMQSQSALTYTNKHLKSSNGDYYIGVTEENGVLKLAGGKDSDHAVEILFASPTAVLPVDSSNHTVSHIDISIEGTSEVDVPLAYGKYYNEDGDPILEVSSNKTVSLIKEGIGISTDDMKKAAIVAYIKDANGHAVPIDNAFYITGYSANAATEYSTPQVRIEGSFKVANLPVTDQDWGHRLNNKIYYSVTAVKTVTFDLIDPKLGQLYDAEGNKLTITIDVAFSASFDYWDERNECPPVKRDPVNWPRGNIPGGSGMDFVLGGDAEQAGSNIVAIEITKLVVDENGNRINPSTSTPVNNSFEIWQDADGNPNSVIGMGIDGAPINVNYADYTNLHSKNVKVGVDGIGLVYDYDVTPGMYYIREDPNSVRDDIVDTDGNYWEYAGTRIETESPWRDDAANDGKMHSSETYTKTDGSYNSVPEVLGNYTDIHGNATWVDHEDGDKVKPVRNGFLEFYVYNIYRPVETDITLKKVDKDQLNEDNPDLLKGASFTVSKYLNENYQGTDTTWGTSGSMTVSDDKNQDGTYTLNGTFVFQGLPAGYYQIEETRFPNGYIKLSDNPRFRIKENANHVLEIELINNPDNLLRLEDDKLTIIVGNPPGAALPNTGGPGTRIFTILGSILIFGAGLVWMRKRRRAEFRTE